MVNPILILPLKIFWGVYSGTITLTTVLLSETLLILGSPLTASVLRLSVLNLRLFSVPVLPEHQNRRFRFPQPNLCPSNLRQPQRGRNCYIIYNYVLLACS